MAPKRVSDIHTLVGVGLSRLTSYANMSYARASRRTDGSGVGDSKGSE